MAGQMHWIRSYFFEEEDGTLGTICIYEAQSADAIREHAAAPSCPRTRCCRSRRPSSHGPTPNPSQPADDEARRDGRRITVGQPMSTTWRPPTLAGVSRDSELVGRARGSRASGSARRDGAKRQWRPGVGHRRGGRRKSRLTREVLGDAGFRLLEGEARQQSAPPYGPVVSALRSFLRVEPDGLAACRPPLRRQLAVLLPELGRAPRQPDGCCSSKPSSERSRSLPPVSRLSCSWTTCNGPTRRPWRTFCPRLRALRDAPARPRRRVPKRRDSSRAPSPLASGAAFDARESSARSCSSRSTADMTARLVSQVLGTQAGARARRDRSRADPRRAVLRRGVRRDARRRPTACTQAGAVSSSAIARTYRYRRASGRRSRRASSASRTPRRRCSRWLQSQARRCSSTFSPSS